MARWQSGEVVEQPPRWMAGAVVAQPEQREKMGRPEAFARGVADGATINLTDEIAGFATQAAEEPDAPISPALADRRSSWPSKFRTRRDDPSQRDPAAWGKYMEGVDAARGKALAVTDAVRAKQKQARSDHPLTYGGGAVGGAVATLPAGGAVARGGQGVVSAAGRAAAAVPGATTAGKAVASAARPVTSAAEKIGRTVSNIPLMGPLLAAAAKNAPAGAAYGAAYGAGEATDDRVMGAMEGVAPGMAGGAIGGAAMRAIGGPLGVLGAVIARDPDKKALAVISREMSRHGVTPAQAAARVKKLDAGDRKVFETSAEFMGPGNEGLQTALGNVTGPSKERLATAFTESVRDVGRNLSRAAKKATGKDPDRYHEARAAHETMRLQRDQANYDAVQGTPRAPHRISVQDFNMYLMRPRQGQATNTPVGLRPRFWRYAEKVLDDAKLDGDSYMAADIKEFLRATQGAQMPRRALSTRAINEIDKRITDDINKALAQERLSDVRILNDLQAGIRALDDLTGLGAVRAQSAVGFGAKGAFEEGRKAFRHGVDVEDVTYNLKDADPEIQDAYIMGMTRSMADALANQSNLSGLADAARKIAATPAMRAKLEAALPKTKRGKLTAKSEEFMEMLGRVSRHTERARQVYGNSATAPRQAAIEEAEAASSSVSGDMLDLVGEVLSRQPGRMMGRIGQGIRNRVSRPGIYDPKINDAMGRRLGATGRKDILAVLDEIDAWNNRKIPLRSDAIDAAGARAGGIAAGTGAAANSMMANDSAGATAEIQSDAFLRLTVSEYLDDATSPERRAEIEAMFGEDAADLRALLSGATVH